MKARRAPETSDFSRVNGLRASERRMAHNRPRRSGRYFSRPRGRGGPEFLFLRAPSSPEEVVFVCGISPARWWSCT
ncbi:hypothetical protein NHX12_020134 [Muraenolepis orangiensis]|uniref:Uncharacterized protein n=1 Tax=Muraenolepis orangiensis TaxID=630683 RepID=A0A9Q0EY31_9TELE|nr:hypothetical protein NHX12_020134 [Muraenolepis orangiensis]